MAVAKSKRKKVPDGQQQLFRRGGRRRGAGRKSKKARPGRRHERRADFSARSPLHVVLRVDEAVRTLRRRAMYKAIRKATITAAQNQRIRIVHISLQRAHIHMIVEAAGREALARGMQGFQISAARYINRALGQENAHATIGVVESSPTCAAWRGPRRGGGTPPRRGCVFVERYYVEVITSPTQALRALTYVLCNWRHHGEDRGAESRNWLVDPFSSGAQFPYWAELAKRDAIWSPPTTQDPLVV